MKDLKDLEKDANRLKDLLDDYSFELDKITFDQFDRCLTTAKDLVKATAYIYELSESGERIPEKLFVNVIRLHNTAVDYIEAMKEYKKKED